MNPTIPSRDGQVTEYSAVLPPNRVPRIYYVNGIQTDGKGHAETAYVLSRLTEHTVYGVYNATAGKSPAGFFRDLLQCGADWTDVFLSKVTEVGYSKIHSAVDAVVDLVRKRRGVASGPPSSLATVRSKIPLQLRLAFASHCLATYNPATASLFQQLSTHLGRKQLIIAHSQGNLITADALMTMVFVFGENSLSNMQVYSLASPAPAWPLGIRYHRKVYGYTNDLVTLCDPHNWTLITGRVAGGEFNRTAGDWRQFGANPLPGIAGHDINRNIALNFARRIRSDLGLPVNTTGAAASKP